MLSYRHAFHAGNHADVLKHFVLVQLLRYLGQKEKPYWLVDTHAGAGCYALEKGYATQNAEFADGIARLWSRSDLPPALADYVAAVRAFNPDGRLRRYPGSPYIAMTLLRAQDRLRLFELHGTDNKLLRENFTRDFPDDARRVAIGQADGFMELKAVLPPPPRRGLVLIDPAFEDKRDYLRTVMATKEGLARFSSGSFAVWYPQLNRGDARELPQKLKKLAPDWLNVALTVRTPADTGYGLHGSGMFVANPPYTLAQTLHDTLPFLRDALALDAGAGFALETSEAAAAPARKAQAPRATGSALRR
ncbi:MAG: 23S rRNA (adenine(2030)-N(6))-methyltransferase RlmJ [Rhodocyclales bacterium]|nr:23S rRNA (adenine(2030)-N(6))-methyltransferase RlmJ [Rhodocyclales bacterium]